MFDFRVSIDRAVIVRCSIRGGLHCGRELIQGVTVVVAEMEAPKRWRDLKRGKQRMTKEKSWKLGKADLLIVKVCMGRAAKASTASRCSK